MNATQLGPNGSNAHEANLTSTEDKICNDVADKIITLTLVATAKNPPVFLPLPSSYGNTINVSTSSPSLKYSTGSVPRGSNSNKLSCSLILLRLPPLALLPNAKQTRQSLSPTNNKLPFTQNILSPMTPLFKLTTTPPSSSPVSTQRHNNFLPLFVNNTNVTPVLQSKGLTLPYTRKCYRVRPYKFPPSQGVKVHNHNQTTVPSTNDSPGR